MEPHWKCESTEPISNADAAKFMRSFINSSLLGPNNTTQAPLSGISIDIRAMFQSVKATVEDERRRQGKK